MVGAHYNLKWSIDGAAVLRPYKPKLPYGWVR
jgi:hypothetical protein